MSSLANDVAANKRSLSTCSSDRTVSADEELNGDMVLKLNWDLRDQITAHLNDLSKLFYLEMSHQANSPVSKEKLNETGILILLLSDLPIRSTESAANQMTHSNQPKKKIKSDDSLESPVELAFKMSHRARMQIIEHLIMFRAHASSTDDRPLNNQTKKEFVQKSKQIIHDLQDLELSLELSLKSLSSDVTSEPEPENENKSSSSYIQVNDASELKAQLKQNPASCKEPWNQLFGRPAKVTARQTNAVRSESLASLSKVKCGKIDTFTHAQHSKPVPLSDHHNVGTATPIEINSTASGPPCKLTNQADTHERNVKDILISEIPGETSFTVELREWENMFKSTNRIFLPVNMILPKYNIQFKLSYKVTNLERHQYLSFQLNSYSAKFVISSTFAFKLLSQSSAYPEQVVKEVDHVFRHYDYRSSQLISFSALSGHRHRYVRNNSIYVQVLFRLKSLVNTEE